MKIAYLFVGHSRTWDKCYQNFFDHIYNFAPGDIYIHTWDTVNTSIGSWWNDWFDLEGDKLAMSMQTPDFSAIYNAYKPKYLLIEREPPIIEMPIKSDLNAKRNKANSAVRNVLKSLKYLFEVSRTRDRYDKFFCTRMDIKYLSDLNPEDLNATSLLSPPSGHPRNIHDIWMIGNENQIEIKSNYVNHIDEYWYNRTDHNNYDHEMSLTDYLYDNKVQLENIHIKYEVVRLF